MFEQKARELEYFERFYRNEGFAGGASLFVCASVLESWPCALDSESSLPYWELRATRHMNCLYFLSRVACMVIK